MTDSANHGASEPNESPSEGVDALVMAAVGGSAEALQEVLGTSGPRVARRVRIDPRWSRALSVEDVMQVTYMEAFLRIRSLGSTTRGGFEAWLTRIAKNNLVDAVRSLQAAKRPDSAERMTSGFAGESSRTLLQAIQGSSDGALTQLGRTESVEALMDAIGKLPQSYREVVRALDLDERAAGDYATELGKSVGAVHMLRSRAHDRLRELLLG
jgi:RNA polymerase sigma factor (sigma-70 family)